MKSKLTFLFCFFMVSALCAMEEEDNGPIAVQMNDSLFTYGTCMQANHCLVCGSAVGACVCCLMVPKIGTAGAIIGSVLLTKMGIERWVYGAELEDQVVNKRSTDDCFSNSCRVLCCIMPYKK